MNINLINRCFIVWYRNKARGGHHKFEQLRFDKNLNRIYISQSIYSTLIGLDTEKKSTEKFGEFCKNFYAFLSSKLECNE